MKHENIAQYLQDNGLGVMGQSIFIGFIPPEVKFGILLRDDFAGTKRDAELPGFYKTSYMLIVRSPAYEQGRALIDQAIALLDFLEERQIGDALFKSSVVRREPFSYPYSPGGLVEFKTEIDCVYVVG